MDPNVIEQFKQITNSDDNVAKFFLESAGGNVEMAIMNYFNQGGSTNTTSGGDDLYGGMEDDDGDATMIPQATPLTSAPTSGGGRTLSGNFVSGVSNPSSTTTTGSKPPVSSSAKKFGTIKDLTGEEKPANPKENRYYAGGSKNSGQQIIGPNDDDDSDDEDNHFADKIFKSAQKQGAKTASEYEDEERRNKPKFEGGGRRLGVSEDKSAVIEAEKKKAEKVVTIVFWSDGFTVNDGELREYEAQENRQFLDSINRGVAPRELFEPGVDIAVNLINKKTEKYAEQPKSFKAFVGSGRSLGAPSSSSSSSSSSTVTSSSSSSSSSVPIKFEVDPNKPTTSLQIRLADGGRLVGKFNLNHTIGDIKQFIRSSKPSAPFDIMTQFPNKVLTEDASTIEEAGLKGATIIQKLK